MYSDCVENLSLLGAILLKDYFGSGCFFLRVCDSGKGVLSKIGCPRVKSPTSIIILDVSIPSRGLPKW